MGVLKNAWGKSTIKKLSVPWDYLGENKIPNLSLLELTILQKPTTLLHHRSREGSLTTQYFPTRCY